MTETLQRTGAGLKIAGRSAAAGLKSFFYATLAFGALGLALTGGCLIITREAGGWAMLSAACLAFACTAVAWHVVATRRATAAALGVALQLSEPGRHVMELIFARLLGVDPDEELGERGRQPARLAERLPLRKVEDELSQAVDNLLAERSQRNGARAWMAQKVRNASLRQVQRLTLEELRDQNARHGGVDLIQVRDRLGDRIHKKAASMIFKGSRRTTRLALLMLLSVSLGGAVGIRTLFLC